MAAEIAQRTSEETMKMITVRREPLPSFGQNEFSRAVQRFFSALELSAAVLHGRWSTAMRAIDRRRSAIVPAMVAGRRRSISATRAAAVRCSAALSSAGATVKRGSAIAWRSGMGWSVAVGSFAADHARRVRALAGPKIRQAMLFTARHSRHAAVAAGRWLRKFAGTEPPEDVVELDLVDLVSIEDRLLAGIGTPRLPTFDAATSNDVELESYCDERASDICSPAVVRLAKMSGHEARIDCSPRCVTASTWRPVRASRALSSAQ